MTPAVAVEGGLPLVVEHLATLGDEDLIEAAGERLFLAGELRAVDALAGVGGVQRDLLELVPRVGRFLDQVGAVEHGRDVEQAGDHPQVAITPGGVEQAGNEIGELVLGPVALQRLEATGLDVLREEAAVVPAHVVVYGAGGEVLDQALVGLEAITFECVFDLCPGLLFPGGNELVELVVVARR